MNPHQLQSLLSIFYSSCCVNAQSRTLIYCRFLWVMILGEYHITLKFFNNFWQFGSIKCENICGDNLTFLLSCEKDKHKNLFISPEQQQIQWNTLPIRDHICFRTCLLAQSGIDILASMMFLLETFLLCDSQSQGMCFLPCQSSEFKCMIRTWDDKADQETRF